MPQLRFTAAGFVASDFVLWERKMAVTGSFSLNTLFVFADDNSNSVVVSRDAGGNILLNGSLISGSPTVANTSLIRIDGFASNDLITLDQSTGALPDANMFGGDGDDVMTSGAGADILSGDAGNDILGGLGGNDLLMGGLGNDRLTGGDGDDQMFGGGGDDRLIWNPGDDSDFFEGGPGVDTAEVNGGGGGEEFVVLSLGGRVLFARSNPAPFLIDIGTTENLVLNANGGDDFFAVSGGDVPMRLTINGGAGNDSLTTGTGADVLNGGDNTDQLFGEAGNDTYVLGAEASGIDTVTDSAGIDRITTTITRSLSFSGYSEIENLTLLGSGAINGIGNTRANTITGNQNANTLSGVNGNDALNGLGGSDTLSGGTGLDRLTGGLGADRLTGGAQADRFIFNSITESRSGGGRDTIVDFNHAQGDRIQLSAIDANTKLAGNQAFSFIGTAAFSGVAGQLRYVKIGADSHIYSDINGDRVIDMHIISNVAANFTAADFVL